MPMKKLILTFLALAGCGGGYAEKLSIYNGEVAELERLEAKRAAVISEKQQSDDAASRAVTEGLEKLDNLGVEYSKTQPDPQAAFEEWTKKSRPEREKLQALRRELMAKSNADVAAILEPLNVAIEAQRKKVEKARQAKDAGS